MFPWELRSIDCSERTEITTLFVIGKGKEGKRGRRIRNVTFFLICLKVSFFEKSQQKSHEVVITFLLPLLKTRTWVLWHEIVQSHMKTADVNMKTWKKMKKFSLQAAFDTFLLLDVLWKAGGGGKLVHHLQDGFLFWWKIEILPLLLWTSVKVINLSMTSMKLLKHRNIRPKRI